MADDKTAGNALVPSGGITATTDVDLPELAADDSGKNRVKGQGEQTDDNTTYVAYTDADGKPRRVTSTRYAELGL